MGRARPPRLTAGELLLHGAFTGCTGEYLRLFTRSDCLNRTLIKHKNNWKNMGRVDDYTSAFSVDHTPSTQPQHVYILSLSSIITNMDSNNYC